MLYYFNFPLVFAVLFNAALFHYFTIYPCIILLSHYYFNTVLYTVTLDECFSFSILSKNIALLMSRVLLTITFSCENC